MICFNHLVGRTSFKSTWDKMEQVVTRGKNKATTENKEETVLKD